MKNRRSCTCAFEGTAIRVSPFEKWECITSTPSLRVLEEIDVGGSTDSTGVWIWMLLPRQKRSKERPRSAMGKRVSLLALGKAFQNKEPWCWFNGGQYVNQWLAVVTMSRPRRSVSSYLLRHRRHYQATISSKNLEDVQLCVMIVGTFVREKYYGDNWERVRKKELKIMFIVLY